jgi:hypothetical protein
MKPPKMEPYACAAIDNYWNHHRNAKMQTVDGIDCRSGRSVDFEIVVKKTDFREGNFEGLSNSIRRSLGSEGCRRGAFIIRMSDTLWRTRILSFGIKA